MTIIITDTITITVVYTLLCAAHKHDYLHYIFIFPQFSPNRTLRRGPCDMPAYCLFPRVQHHLHGSGEAASLWRWQMGQGHSLLKRCAAQLQVEFAMQALRPVCKVIYKIWYKRIGESKSCTSVQEWRVVGKYRWRDVERGAISEAEIMREAELPSGTEARRCWLLSCCCKVRGKV